MLRRNAISCTTSCVIAEAYLPFCNCSDAALHPRVIDCTCGEADTCTYWLWDRLSRTCYSVISADARTVRFSTAIGKSTNVARGDRLLVSGHHFWEVKLVGPVYGAEIVVGIGCAEVRLSEYSVYSVFFSPVGSSSSTWGVSHSGMLCHAGLRQEVYCRFGQGSIVGVHLDIPRKVADFYVNRRKVCTVLVDGESFYPMVSARRAKCAMRIIRSVSVCELSLQYACCAALRTMRPDAANIFDGLPVPARLKAQLSQRFCWITDMR